MKKKLLMRLAAAALAVGMCLSSAGASYFTDVSPNAWYYDAVTECSDYGLLNGYQNRERINFTRAECAALLDWRNEPLCFAIKRKWIGISYNAGDKINCEQKSRTWCAWFTIRVKITRINAIT